MILITSEAVLDSWPHHEWKQVKDFPQQQSDEGLRRLLGPAPPTDCLIGADSQRDNQSNLSRRGSVGRGLVSRLGAIFHRRR